MTLIPLESCLNMDGKKNTECNMVSIKMIPFCGYIKLAGLKMIQVPIGTG